MKLYLLRWMEAFALDGLRLDSVNNIANWDFVQEFKDLARQYWAESGSAPDRFLVVGEELSVPKELVTQGRLDGLWNEDFKRMVRNVVLGRNDDKEPSFEWSVRKLIDCRLMGFSDGAKRRGREVATMHPVDAKPRGIADGDIVRLFNERGACLAAVQVTDGIAPGVVQLPTGAWYDPMDPEDEKPLCVHGNPNVLTRDVGTSSFAQGCTGQLTTVEVERFNGNLPPIRAFDPV